MKKKKHYAVRGTAALLAALTAAVAWGKSAYVPEPRPVKSAVEITALYYPGTEHMPEWDMVRQTRPEIKPLLGWYDEGDPENIDWQIKWAVEHGISSFCVDWYWNRGSRRLEHWVKGYYRAKFRRYLKWYMMYANHNQPGSHSTADQIAVTRYWLENYFKTPEYYTIGGKPVVVLWQLSRIDEDFIAEAAAKGEKMAKGEGVKRAFAISEKMVRDAGLPGICWINMANAKQRDPKQHAFVQSLGFVGQMTYNLGATGPYNMCPEARTPEDSPRHSSFDLMALAAKKIWEVADVYPELPFWPLLPTGWDDRPRSFQNACVTYGRTQEKYRILCGEARRFCERRGLKRVVIAPVNEWQEGSYIEPNEEYGFAMYDAIRDAFCEKPAGGWPKNLSPKDLGRPLREFPPVIRVAKPVWEFSGTTEGWYRQPYGGGEVECHDGALTFVINRRHNFNIRCRPQPFAAEKFRKFSLRMRITPNARSGLGDVKAPALRLKWGTEASPIISSKCTVDQSRSVASAPVTCDGGWHEYTVDLTANPDWRGKVNELWFEAADVLHARVAVDRMKFE
ncbi:MAG: glycoside hydrolase family 99-like domain-containing protein [Kiritimatiellae bacterium]|nr:glycoside hydrolase family 99-like domain-containing protein [Kiritimatiellia bacterium]